MGKNKSNKQEEIKLSKKDAKKVAKLEAMIPYHEGRKNDEEVTKLKEQIASIWEKAKEASWQ
eukprot:CAMPEP_0204612404 /NCGR_PEP_ID=MMETSP0717-20131115/494_1 /ASSEMBLY_ACC=CAM_ASM_000666 /TAXON_ID=230516 /ORGANISM="Chaetoceros curvisetus" /LENGTH=61 /DNA_ID=CAMNT_0051624477 /DNA_START=65 /DNA_END=250 /DNA_ORIENTATION=-